MSADPQRLTGLADRFTRSLARIERRAVRSLTVSLRRSLARVLTFLRSHYLSYINELGPQGYDPARNPIRRPGDYQVADAAGRFRPILLDVQQFMPEEEIRQWIAGYERDLREAARLGQQLGLAFARAMDRPAPGELFNGVDPLVIRATAATTGAYVQGETAKFRSQLVDIVSEGATRGWGPKRLERSIRQALEGSKDAAGVTKRLGLRQRAELIARTELANVYSRGTLERARLQGSSYVRLLASNDERTCPICASRNGRVYPADRVAVPLHPRCRCVLVPVPDEAVQEREGQTRDVLLDGERWRAEHERGIEAYAEAKGISLDQARIDLARALNTPTASEKRLSPTNPFPLPESVPLYPDPASSR